MVERINQTSRCKNTFFFLGAMMPIAAKGRVMLVIALHSKIEKGH
jgi:hypothetical protein